MDDPDELRNLQTDPGYAGMRGNTTGVCRYARVYNRSMQVCGVYNRGMQVCGGIQQGYAGAKSKSKKHQAGRLLTSSTCHNL